MEENKINKKARFGVIIGFLISIILLVYVFSGVENWQSLANAFARMNYSYLLPMILIVTCAMIIRAWRWRFFFPSEQRPSLRDSFDAMMLGFLVSFILPLRAGEFARPIALRTFTNIRFSVGLATVVVERVFDVLSVIFFLGLSLGQMEDVPKLVMTGSVALAGVAGAIIVGVFLSYVCPRHIKVLARFVLSFILEARFPKLFKSLYEMAEGIIEGLSAISSVKTLFGIILLSLSLWFLMGIFYLIALHLMGVNAVFWAGIMVNVITALAIAAPSAPGFLGTFQVGCVLALTTIYGYPQEISLAYSIVALAIQAFYIYLFGAYILMHRGLKFSEIH